MTDASIQKDRQQALHVDERAGLPAARDHKAIPVSSEEDPSGYLQDVIAQARSDKLYEGKLHNHGEYTLSGGGAEFDPRSDRLILHEVGRDPMSNRSFLSAVMRADFVDPHMTKMTEIPSNPGNVMIVARYFTGETAGLYPATQIDIKMSLQHAVEIVRDMATVMKIPQHLLAPAFSNFFPPPAEGTPVAPIDPRFARSASIPLAKMLIPAK